MLQQRLKQILQNTKAYNVSNEPLAAHANLIYVPGKELSFQTPMKIFKINAERKSLI